MTEKPIIPFNSKSFKDLLKENAKLHKQINNYKEELDTLQSTDLTSIINSLSSLDKSYKESNNHIFNLSTNLEVNNALIKDINNSPKEIIKEVIVEKIVNKTVGITGEQLKRVLNIAQTTTVNNARYGTKGDFKKVIDKYRKEIYNQFKPPKK